MRLSSLNPKLADAAPVALAFLVLGATALSTQDRQACQTLTQNPLDGCPAGTLLVDASHGAGSRPAFASSESHKRNANATVFSTIQAAVVSLPHDNSSQTILILPGVYTEQVNVTRPGPLYLLGQTEEPNSLANSVEVIWHQATGNANSSIDNAYTSTLTVAPTLNSSLTGAGPTGNPVPDDTPFGSVDFRAYNVNFTNEYLPYSAGPSLALSTSYANTGFYHCAFKSWQDTVYVGKLANSYMTASEIAGQTDFLYGFGTLYITNSTLRLRSCGGGITAWKGTNTSYANKYGAYISHSSVLASNSSIAPQIVGQCALGRPWNSQHRSVFSHCYLDASIRKEGYVEWSATDPRVVPGVTMMAEFEDEGPGWSVEGRKDGNVTVLLSEADFEAYASPAKVFQFFKSGRTGNTAWIDKNV